MARTFSQRNSLRMKRMRKPRPSWIQPRKQLFSRRNPNVLDLGCVADVSLRLAPIGRIVIRVFSKPRPRLLEISCRKFFHFRAPFHRSEVPRRIDSVVLEESLFELVSLARDDVHDPRRKIGGVENLIKLGGA